MLDRTSLATVDPITLESGVRFLRALAREALKQKQGQRDTPAAGEARSFGQISTDLAPPAGILDGPFLPTTIDFTAMAQLGLLRLALRAFAEGAEIVATTDELPLVTVDIVRQALEIIYAHRITFKGEQRPPSGPLAVVDAEQLIAELSEFSNPPLTIQEILGDSTEWQVRAERGTGRTTRPGKPPRGGGSSA